MNIEYFDIQYAADKDIKYLFEYQIFAKIFNIEHLDVNMIADRTTYFTACKNSVYQLMINIKYFLIVELKFHNIFKNQMLLFTRIAINILDIFSRLYLKARKDLFHSKLRERGMSKRSGFDL